MTLVRAGFRMIKEVRALRPEVSTEIDFEMDGFGYNRTLWFDEPTARWLGPIMAIIEKNDARIEAVHFSRTGRIGVTFVGDVRADFEQDFGIAQVDEVLNAPDESPPPQSDKPRKRASKKAGAQ